MAQGVANSWTRRDFMAGAALLALAVGVPVAAIKLSDLSGSAAEEAPSDRARALIREVSDLVLPRTGTAGAGDVGVGDFVILALAHGLEGARAPLEPTAAAAFTPFLRRDGSLRYLDWLEAELDKRGSGDFLRRAPAERLAILSRLDAEAFAPEVKGHPWKVLKGLILTGYYTSETGGAKELHYELVPGRWDADVPCKPGTIAWSSDWTAVDFG